WNGKLFSGWVRKIISEPSRAEPSRAAKILTHSSLPFLALFHASHKSCSCIIYVLVCCLTATCSDT
ncbi:hypothetical protein SDJN02_06707, partial [Cucurbita argyrosperma subsp. argyrosperma]